MTSEEIQKYRLRVPEPSWVNYSVIRFKVYKEITCWLDTDPEIYTTFQCGEFQKIRCYTADGCLFEAWSYDGKTPVFPIPQ